MELQLIQQTGGQALLGDGGAATDRDILVTGGSPGLIDGRLDAVCDERERSAALLGDGVPRVVGEDEDRVVKRRLVTPPAVGPGVVFPRSMAAAEHPAAHHRRAGR